MLALASCWGVFLTGSDTSANALFGNLQAVSAQHLGMNPVLMASANSSGGVIGKMVSQTSTARMLVCSASRCGTALPSR